MGYTTYFDGAFQFDKPVTDELKNYINKFSETRRMMRDNDKIKELFPNWEELCFNGELGEDGEYFVGGDSYLYFGLSTTTMNLYGMRAKSSITM